jgi:hypothetical protein
MEKSHFPGEGLIDRSDEIYVNGITDLTLYRLSAAQLGIWFAQALDPDSPIFNIGEYLEIFGPIAPMLFEKAVRQAVAETDALQARFIETDDGPRQYFAPDPNWVMPFIDVSAEVDPRASAKVWMHHDLGHPSDLTQGPLFTVALFRSAPDHFFYYQRFHHIVADGASLLMLAQRVASLYSALAEGRPVEVGNVGSSLDLLDDEGEYRSSVRYVRDRDYWHEQLENWPEPVTLSGQPPARSRYDIRCTEHLPGRITDALRAFGTAHGMSFPQVITTAVALYLYRLTGSRDLTMGLPVTARVGARRQRTFGMVSNVLRLRPVIEPGDKLADLLHQVARRMRDALRHQLYRTEDLCRDFRLHPDETGVYGTVVNIIPFNYNLRFAGHTRHANIFCQLGQ